MKIKTRKPNFHRSLSVIILVAALSVPVLARPSPPPVPVLPPAPVLTGDASCAWGSFDCNRCVSNVVSTFNSLRDHGDVMGFRMTGFYDDLGFCNGCSHWQGVQRLPGANGRYLAVSRSGLMMFNVVKMASRNTAGERFRSNRLNPSYHYHQTAPPTTDRIVYQRVNDPGFDHAGGMQALGHVLAVPLEASSSKVAFFDLTNPASPVWLYNVPHPESSQAGTASLAKLGDGRFLLVIGRANANILDFYVSSGTNLSTASFARFDTWSEWELWSSIGDWEFGNYQNLSFVTQCDGSLYLIGTHENSAIGIGQDWADLFLVQNGSGDQVRIIKRAKKHLYCSYPSPGASGSQDNHCNLDAAGGVYVDPDGMLIIYGTEHANDGPSATARFMEFRSTFPNPTCSTDINHAFVELYDDSDWSDRGLMIDYPDRYLEDYSNYDRTEGFEDKASAVRYCIPPGWRYRLYKDKYYRGGYHDLIGSGSKNLGSYGFGDKTSSSRWLSY